MSYIVYTILLIALIKFYFRIALKFQIMDKPGDRSSHRESVIRGAGIIFPVGILIWFIYSGFTYPWFLGGLILISLISFLDDLSHVLRGIRIVTQVAAIALLMVQLGFSPYPWWVWALILFFAVGIINAFNFMDGINGMTAGYSIVALFTLWYVNNFLLFFIDNELIYAASIAVLIFGFFNFRTKACCFAGDVGPISIAFILIFLISKLILVSGNISYLLLLCLYGIDTSYTLIRRLLRHENVFKPHRKHLYQTFTNEIGYSQIKVSIGYALVQLLINSLIIFLGLHLSNLYLAIISVGILLILSITYVAIKSRFPRSSSGI